MAFDLAVVGVTGAVGSTMLKVLGDMDLPISNLYPYASLRSAGENCTFKGRSMEVLPLKGEIKGDAVLLAVSADLSESIWNTHKNTNKYFIDNSSRFRMDKKTPLVVPSINGDTIPRYPGLISNPNCSTIELLLALDPVKRHYGIESLTITTLQSVSGSGNAAIKALGEETLEYLKNDRVTAEYYPQPIAFNVIPAIGDFLDNGSTEEEEKLLEETRKIFGDDSIQVTATALRVPTFYSHFESVTVKTKQKVVLEELRDIFMGDPYLKLMDTPSGALFPSPLSTSGTDNVEVGRIRVSRFNDNEFSMVISADNLRIGAATNAVRILSLINDKGLI